MVILVNVLGIDTIIVLLDQATHKSSQQILFRLRKICVMKLYHIFVFIWAYSDHNFFSQIK